MLKDEMLEAAKSIWLNQKPKPLGKRKYSFKVINQGPQKLAVACNLKQPDQVIWNLSKLGWQIEHSLSILDSLASSKIDSDQYTVIMLLEWLPNKWVACNFKLKARDEFTLDIYDPAGIIVFENEQNWLGLASKKFKQYFDEDAKFTVKIHNIKRSAVLQLNSGPLVLNCLHDLFTTNAHAYSLKAPKDKLNEAIDLLNVRLPKLSITIVEEPVETKTKLISPPITPPSELALKLPTPVPTPIPTPVEHIMRAGQINFAKGYYQFAPEEGPYKMDQNIFSGAEYINGSKKYLTMQASEYNGDFIFHDNSLHRGPFGRERTTVKLAGPSILYNMTSSDPFAGMIMGGPIQNIGILAYLEYIGPVNKIGLPHSFQDRDMPGRIGYLYIVAINEDGITKSCLLDGLFDNGRLQKSSLMTHTYKRNLSEKTMNAAASHYNSWYQLFAYPLPTQGPTPKKSLANNFCIGTYFEGERLGESLINGSAYVFVGAKIDHLPNLDVYMLYRGKVTAGAPHDEDGILELVVIDKTIYPQPLTFIQMFKGKFLHGHALFAQWDPSPCYHVFKDEQIGILFAHLARNANKLSTNLFEQDADLVNAIRKEAFLTTNAGRRFFGETPLAIDSIKKLPSISADHPELYVNRPQMFCPLYHVHPSYKLNAKGIAEQQAANRDIKKEWCGNYLKRFNLS